MQESNFSKLIQAFERSRYLSDSERKVIIHCQNALQSFYDELQKENPKFVSARDIITNNNELIIICPDARLLQDLEWAYEDLGTKVISGYREDIDKSSGAIITGWFRKERLSRLLVPPITQELHLLLYDIERSWYSGFLNGRQKNRQKRNANKNRSKLFPNINGWVDTDSKQRKTRQREDKFSNLKYEEIHQDILSDYRNRVYRNAKTTINEEEISAHLVVFEGGAYAFLTEYYQANVVTHLLERSIIEEDEKADIKPKYVKNLEVGDALLFRRGTESDVIRATADKILPEGTRDTALQWRVALLKYTVREELTPEKVYQKMKKGGCPLKQATIQNWLVNDCMIAPQSHKRDVRIISEVTGDETLSNNLENVLSAIRKVRSAHLKVSNLIAKRILARAVSILKEEDNQASMIEVDANVLLVRVNHIDEQPIMVRASLSNRLIEGELWLE